MGRVGPKSRPGAVLRNLVVVLFLIGNVYLHVKEKNLRFLYKMSVSYNMYNLNVVLHIDLWDTVLTNLNEEAENLVIH